MTSFIFLFVKVCGWTEASWWWMLWFFLIEGFFVIATDRVVDR